VDWFSPALGFLHFSEWVCFTLNSEAQCIMQGGFVGRLFDAYGPTLLLASGTVILTFSLMMTSLATKYYEFILAQGVVFGIGFGLL
jgi:hypothetical protein